MTGWGGGRVCAVVGNVLVLSPGHTHTIGTRQFDACVYIASEMSIISIVKLPPGPPTVEKKIDNNCYAASIYTRSV